MELPLDVLLGRAVVATNGRVIGRIEEFRVDDTERWTVAEVVLGAAGLLERLGIGGRMLVGARTGGYVARWDQIDLTDPRRPRLRCGVEALERL
jgi:hypothetical protein